MIAIVILAAGQSTRMRGGDKLLENVDGQPCLSHLVNEARATGLSPYVVVPDLDHPRAIAAKGARMIPAPEASLGMAHSLRAGLAALPADTTAMIVLPGDMPEVTTADILQVAEIHHREGTGIVQAATEDGAPGHPILFAARYFDDIATLTGDRGAWAIVQAHRADWQLTRLEGQRARRDLDTPEDWAAWRAERTKTSP